MYGKSELKELIFSLVSAISVCQNKVYYSQLLRSKIKCNNCIKALRKAKITVTNIWSVNTVNIKRGDIYYADLSPVVGSEQGGVRPVLIVQNNVGNKFSPTVIAAAITSQQSKANLPTHIPLHANTSGLAKDSVVLLEQVRTIDKKRLKEKMGSIDDDSMSAINDAISISFGL